MVAESGLDESQDRVEDLERLAAWSRQASSALKRRASEVIHPWLDEQTGRIPTDVRAAILALLYVNTSPPTLESWDHMNEVAKTLKKAI